MRCLSRAGMLWGVCLVMGVGTACGQNLHLGDLDDDGEVTVRDLALLNDHISGTPSLLANPGPFDAAHAVLADVNKDGAVNSGDRDELIKEILQSRSRETLPLATVRFTSPAGGEGDVAVTRETIVHFTIPLSLEATIDTSRFYAEFAGRKVLSRAEISSDRRKATLFFLENLPANSRIKVTFDGSGLTDLIGRPFDANGDGSAVGGEEAGGTELHQFSFDTVTTAGIGTTGVTGRVLAAAPVGLAQPPAGWVPTPVAGVTITVDGAEETLRTTTDAQGRFTLSPCPSGTFFVHIDGRTSPLSAWPGGDYYPSVGKQWEAVAGKTDNLAAGTGVVYLPCVCAGTLQSVSATQPTRITFPPRVLAANPQLAGTEFTVPANALFSDDGTRGGNVGPAPVPADRLPSPLPPNLRLPFVFSFQSNGPTNFERPVAVCLPNLPDPLTGYLPVPGEKCALVAFNHDNGQWEVVGPMTVTADGKFMKTDAGVGLRQPGWGGGTPGGAAPGTGAVGGMGVSPPNGKSLAPCIGPDRWQIAELMYDILVDVLNCGLEGLGRKRRLLECMIRLGVNQTAWTKEVVKAGVLMKNPTATNLDQAIAIMESLGRTKVLLTEDLSCFADPSQFNLLTDGIVCAERVLRDLDGFCGVMKDVNGKPCEPTRGTQVVCKGIQDAYTLVAAAKALVTQFNQIVKSFLAKRITGALLCATYDNLLSELKLLKSIRAGSGGRARDGIPGPTADEVLTQIRGRLDTLSTQLTEVDKVSKPADENLRALNSSADQITSLSESASAWIAEQGDEVVGGGYFSIVIGDQVFRGRLDASGLPPAQILSPNEDFKFSKYLPGKQLYGEANGITRAIGQQSRLPTVLMRSVATLPDVDEDGIPDAGEDVIGTSPTNPDTDGDSITDGAELKNGSDPLSGIAVSTGVIGRAPLTGTCVDIAAGRDVLAAACGAEGVYILSVRQGLTPTRLAQVTVVPNVANVVTIDANYLVIGLGATGTMVVDISRPDTPQFLRLIKLGSRVRSVAAVEGIAYIGLEDGRVAAVEMITGRLIGSANLGAAPHDLAVGRGVVYAVVSGSVRALPVTGSGFGVVGSAPSNTNVPVTTGRFRLFRGTNRLYVTHGSGVTAYDISVPARPVRLQDNGTAALGWSHLVATGANLAVATLGANTSDDVSLYDLGPSGAELNFLTTFATPGASTALTIYNGLAYVVDGTAGVQVVNFRAFDTARIPPAVVLASEVTGDTVEEGRFLAVMATVTDDVQVRNVEFLVDGEVVETDGNFPFEARLLAPRSVAGKTTFTVQARCADTGGNTALSNALTFSLSNDTQRPTVQSFSPGNDALLATASGFSVRFTEPVAAATLNGGTVYLFGAGADGVVGTDDDVRVPVTLGPATEGSGAFRDTADFQTVGPLGAGRYRVVLTIGITDAKGNPLEGAFTSAFQVNSGTDADGDGIPDNVEALLGMDAENQDSDGDGMPDGLEDFDGDRLGNQWELRYGLDARLKDSNGNGTNDDLEDADRDTLNTFQEMAAGSDPNKADTDGDGWPDQVEVEFSARPNDARSKPLSLFVSEPPVTVGLIGQGTTVGGQPEVTVGLIGEGPTTAAPPVLMVPLGGGTSVATPPVNVKIGR